jgi:hypothetical protein
MAIETSTVDISAGTEDIAGDRVGSNFHQSVKTMLGADGSETAFLAGRADGSDGIAYVDSRPLVVRKSVTPTISTSIYAAKDNIGGLMEFTNCVRASGGTGYLECLQIVDQDQEMPDVDIVFFDRTVAGTVTDNAAFDPDNADLLNVICRVPIGGLWADFNDNAVAHAHVGTAFKLNGTSIFGAIVARGTPTFTATSDITVVLTIRQD